MARKLGEPEIVHGGNKCSNGQDSYSYCEFIRVPTNFFIDGSTENMFAISFIKQPAELVYVIV